MRHNRGNSGEQGRPARVSVAGRRPRPLAIDVVDERLSFVGNPKKRGLLAHHVAETCYECFDVENLFRELIECDPKDFDGILTALVNLDIQLRHIAADHWPILERLLTAAIRAADRAISRDMKPPHPSKTKLRPHTKR